MGFNHPVTEVMTPTFHDKDADQTMFRIVVKNNMTRNMADHLLGSFEEAFDFLDSVDFSALGKSSCLAENDGTALSWN